MNVGDARMAPNNAMQLAVSASLRLRGKRRAAPPATDRER